MAREVDPRKQRKALRKLRQAAALSKQGLGPPLSDWEVEFLAELEARIETYGSAFADPEKGNRDEPLSALQTQKLKEIDRKARGKSRSGFKRKTPQSRTSVRQLDEDVQAEEKPPAPPADRNTKLKLVENNQPPPTITETKSQRTRPKLKLIKTDPEA
ncbi:MAG: hypothetical protein ACPH4G_00010 [Henriciella sp.]